MLLKGARYYRPLCRLTIFRGMINNHFAVWAAIIKLELADYSVIFWYLAGRFQASASRSYASPPTAIKYFRQAISSLASAGTSVWILCHLIFIPTFKAWYMPYYGFAGEWALKSRCYIESHIYISRLQTCLYDGPTRQASANIASFSLIIIENNYGIAARSIFSVIQKITNITISKIMSLIRSGSRPAAAGMYRMRWSRVAETQNEQC